MEHNVGTVIETVNLTKKYKKKVAVNQLNLSINRGEVFGLLGPNGAGKTTTILMLLGLTEPTEGNACINGMDCTRNPIGVKSIVGYLPDNVGFYSDMTGRENLRYTGKLNGVPEDILESRINELLERVGMTEAADKKTRTYSRGMRQRLGVADVMMKDPEVIIMDEPTLGLDPEGMRELLNLIRQLSREDGKTVLISSHQLYQVQQVCDRVGIFVKGNLVACGGIEELGKQISTDKSFRLELQTEPCDERLVQEIRSYEGVEQVEQEGDTLRIRAAGDIRQQLTEFLGANGYIVMQMRRSGGSLEDIYRLYFERAGQSDENSKREKGKGRGKRKAFEFSKKLGKKQG